MTRCYREKIRSYANVLLFVKSMGNQNMKPVNVKRNSECRSTKFHSAISRQSRELPKISLQRQNTLSDDAQFMSINEGVCNEIVFSEVDELATPTVIPLRLQNDGIFTTVLCQNLKHL
ncbi:hypothetical protein AB6A40_006088 [Gnathostoma spinigerum]|uniref:Uncharacterized protein n=1 Tax=Gnathostoma spinigerum TaxID=75299 RepID=A0ABD6EHC5_9BILA